MNPAIEFISEIVLDSFTAVLSSQLLEPGACEHRRLVASYDGFDDNKVGLLEFNSPELQGFLQLFLPEECVDPVSLYDAGELVNQMAGRLSNRLYNYGFSIKTTTPRIIRSSVFEAQRDLSDAEIFLTSSSKQGLQLKTVIGPVGIVEQLADRFSERKRAALREGAMVLFDADKPGE
jgi:hypothetical protein